MTKIASYFLDASAPATSSYITVGLIGSGLLLVFGLIVPLGRYAWRRNLKPRFGLMYSIAGVARIAGLTFLILFFLRYQALKPFHYRGWVYVAALPFLVWLIVAIRRNVQAKPSDHDLELAERFTKYLPNAKR